MHNNHIKPVAGVLAVHSALVNHQKPFQLLVLSM